MPDVTLPGIQCEGGGVGNLGIDPHCAAHSSAEGIE